jgi:hypothetical protein
MTCETGEELLARKLVLPLYVAVITCEPTINPDALIAARPDPSSKDVPIDTPPSLNVTVPVGMPDPELTFAVSTTLCPQREGSGEEVKVVVVETVLTAKRAVTLLGPSITTVCGFVVPLRSPENPMNTYPELGVAVNVTIVGGIFESNQTVSGAGTYRMLPPALGLAIALSKN